MTNSTVETTLKRSLGELIYYFQAKQSSLQNAIQYTNQKTKRLHLDFSLQEIETEVQIVNETIERLHQAKEDESFYKDVFEMFHQMTELEKNKTLKLLKRVLESQVNNNDVLKNLASAVLESR